MSDLKGLMLEAIRIQEEKIAKLGGGGGGADACYPAWFYRHCDKIEAISRELRRAVEKFRERVEQEQ